jgi:chromosome segregation protein
LRFLRMLKEFSSRTQFIVITHNKATMKEADRLYGITMEESGVSKVVSVRLDAAREEIVSEEQILETA